MSRGKYDPMRHPVRSSGGRLFKMNLKHWGLMAALVVGSNVATHLVFNSGAKAEASVLSRASVVGFNSSSSFYLSEKASRYIYDLAGFHAKVKQVSRRLDIPEEWLLAVMHQESEFNPGVANFQGSGATGLIQFMPMTAGELGTSTMELARMEPIRQMDFVYEYLALVRERYGDFKDLTDLYLAILYPKARGGDYCYTLFAKPSQSYRQNSGLDEDKDGRVTVSDIDRHLKRKYPDAYRVSKQG
ncbi:MAG: lytic transglycosylase domain-containing protein [Bacteroidia bacterium]|nr:lytic transglycosylase domain-containing protein [Bacteroidia bacterium]